jgi:hypothetical protein
MSTLKTIIQAKKAGIFLFTYANFLLRPKPNKRIKDGPIRLSANEVARVKELNGNVHAKWRWVAGQNHSRYIYKESDSGVVQITSVSGFCSGAVENKVNVLVVYGKWLQIETLVAGSDWWNKPIPSWCLHHVYTFRGRKPKCGDVVLPLITRIGYAWIEGWVVE